MEEALEIAKTLGVAIAEILLTIYVCVQYIKKKLKRPDVSKKIPGQNKIDLEIMTQMDYTKELLNADRIHIYEFHNGEHYSDYRSAYKFSCSYEAIKAGKKALIVLPEKNDVVYKSARNIAGVNTTLVNTLNVYDILNCDTIVVLKDAVAKIEEVYA